MTQKIDHLPDARLRLNLLQLEVFVATAREGSTRAAAARVARSQSAASAALAELEAVLGVNLFDRVGRRLLLNENGHALRAKAGALLEHAAEIESLFASEHPAPLRMAASFTIGEYLLPDLVAGWKDANPDSQVQLQIGNTTQAIEAVAGFDVDLGFIEGSQTRPDLTTQGWLSDELAIVSSPTHPLAGQVAGLRQLREADWVLRERGSGTREAADRWLLEHLGRLNVGFELGSTEAIKQFVARGVGLGCVSRYVVAEAIAQGWLVEVRTRLPKALRHLAIVTHRDKHLGRSALAFIDHCMQAARQAH
ncbi:LysR family transcriptional regulator [Verminephrobacter aporrectodeae]|uniref:LysR family transcriptional regulator n=1 Tax=Verminephrobacter aporrectodeae TaxID=1110389 RepID=UPI0002378592|nr:LysR family transcriptional regulator [Verminephrobacter aporrectodeae]